MGYDYTIGKKKQLSSRTTLLSNGQLLAGVHAYNFENILPLECPSSCREKCGKVEYELKVVVADSDIYSKFIFKQPLTIIRYLDLNLHKEYAVSQKSFLK